LSIYIPPKLPCRRPLNYSGKGIAGNPEYPGSPPAKPLIGKNYFTSLLHLYIMVSDSSRGNIKLEKIATVFGIYFPFLS